MKSRADTDINIKLFIPVGLGMKNIMHSRYGMRWKVNGGLLATPDTGIFQIVKWYAWKHTCITPISFSDMLRLELFLFD